MKETNEFETKKKRILKKKKLNRIKRRLAAFLFVIICTGIIFTVLKAPFFNVDDIMCVGQQELTEERIIEIAGAKTGVNVFSASVKDMKKRLNAEPSIAECNVRRLFPNKIKIWVREAKAVASIENAGYLLLTNKNGQIIKIVELEKKDSVAKVASLEGFNPAANGLGEYVCSKDDAVHIKTYECIEILDKLDMIQNITMINAADLSDIRLDYQDRLHIMLGGYEQMEYKLRFIKKVISENLSEYEKAVLDYRGEKLYVEPKTEEPEEEVKAEPEEENVEEKASGEDNESKVNDE
ncbi:MAG: FtsQ-type POTRA domain-containing protein [Clostridia bacterium]|nr:FtsQ-type POTRA domain-containing protein [Clostridia bacterium]